MKKADLGSSMKYRFNNAYAPAEYYISRDPVIYDGYPYNETFLGERQFVLTSTIDGGDDAGRKNRSKPGVW
ncbi:hypothetical protein NXX53_25605 [Bacteroides salyersiae]|nr:hypothetical protein [Bacteroides salyersiae]